MSDKLGFSGSTEYKPLRSEGVKTGISDRHDTHCCMCRKEMDGSEYYDDMCDECARDEGLIEEDEEEIE